MTAKLLSAEQLLRSAEAFGWRQVAAAGHVLGPGEAAWRKGVQALDGHERYLFAIEASTFTVAQLEALETIREVEEIEEVVAVAEGDKGKL